MFYFQFVTILRHILARSLPQTTHDGKGRRAKDMIRRGSYPRYDFEADTLQKLALYAIVTHVMIILKSGGNT